MDSVVTLLDPLPIVVDGTKDRQVRQPRPTFGSAWASAQDRVIARPQKPAPSKNSKVQAWIQPPSAHDSHPPANNRPALTLANDSSSEASESNVKFPPPISPSRAPCESAPHPSVESSP